MPKWTVLLIVSEQIRIEADSEDEAKQIAKGMFDPATLDPDVVEVWRTDDDAKTYDY